MANLLCALETVCNTKSMKRHEMKELKFRVKIEGINIIELLTTYRIVRGVLEA